MGTKIKVSRGLPGAQILGSGETATATTATTTRVVRTMVATVAPAPCKTTMEFTRETSGQITAASANASTRITKIKVSRGLPGAQILGSGETATATTATTTRVVRTMVATVAPALCKT